MEKKTTTKNSAACEKQLARKGTLFAIEYCLKTRLKNKNTKFHNNLD